MCSRAMPRPHVGPKMQTVPAIPSHPASAPVEVEHKGRADVLPDPLVEYADQEVTELARPHGPVCHFLPFLKSGVIVALDDGDELDVVGFQLVAEEPVDVEGVIGVLRVSMVQRMLNSTAVFPGAAARGTQDPLEGAVAGPILAEDVVQLLGDLQAQPNQKIVFVKKPAQLS